MLKITEVYPEYVFRRLGEGKDVDAVDYKRRVYVDLSGQTVSYVQNLTVRAANDKDVKFFQLEVEEEQEGE